jgi:hypothetical protein
MSPEGKDFGLVFEKINTKNILRSGIGFSFQTNF